MKEAFKKKEIMNDAEADNYTCPAGQTLEKAATIQVNGREQYRYSKPSACQICPFRSECTRGANRTITRDANEEIKEDMRKELSIPENKESYKLRAHAAESPFGNIKHNLKYRILLRRSLGRVKIEIGLLCILHNILKISKVLQE